MARTSAPRTPNAVMRFHLRNMLWWTAQIGVVLLVIRYLLVRSAEIQGPRSLVLFRLAIVYIPIILVGVALFNYLTRDKNNRWAIVGAEICGLVAWLVSYRMELGYVIYQWRHPGATNATEEMTRAYGCAVGTMAGAFAGALIGGIAAAVHRWYRRRHEELASS